MRRIFVAALLAAAAAPAAAQQKLDFILNWVPGGDHAPYYYAKKLGWYAKEGIDLNLEPGKGSMLAVQKVGAGANPIGLADMGNVLLAKGKGADTVGVFNVYANSPQGLYWLKSSGIKGIKDFPGKKIGNPAADGARPMWPALAKANGVDPKSVTWVNIDANAKLSALKSKSIDITTSFYNIHHVFQKELGDDMGFVAWREVGLNPYGNSVIVAEDFLKKNKPLVDKFVKVTQRAFAACVKEPKPCVQALVEANGALQMDNEMQNWALVEVLMSDKFSKSVALGIHDDARMKADYELVRDYVGLNTYGNTIIVNGDYLKKNKPVVASFVKVTQKAFAACVKEPKPCVQAMLDANGALQFDNELTNWGLVEVLMSDKFSKSVALGVLDDARMAADYELVKTYIGMDKPFDVKSAYTNEFLDSSVKMTK